MHSAWLSLKTSNVLHSNGPNRQLNWMNSNACILRVGTNCSWRFIHYELLQLDVQRVAVAVAAAIVLAAPTFLCRIWTDKCGACYIVTALYAALRCSESNRQCAHSTVRGLQLHTTSLFPHCNDVRGTSDAICMCAPLWHEYCFWRACVLFLHIIYRECFSVDALRCVSTNQRTLSDVFV